MPVKKIKAEVLIVDDEKKICESIARVIGEEGISFDISYSAEEALLLLSKKEYDLVLCDIRLPNMDGISLLERIKATYPSLRVIIITGYASIETAIKALRLGAYDYVIKPFSPEEINKAISRALENHYLSKENKLLKEVVEFIQGGKLYIGKSTIMKHLFAEANKVAGTDAAVLITGESGSGKEVLAKYIHANSMRRNRPFLAINCAAISEELSGSEIFGHVHGAFTGAISDHRGIIELANEGTLFLDEIAELKPEIQAKLLRVVEEQKFKRIGSEKEQSVNIRILSAMQKPPEKLIKTGKLREDLYFRLGVVQLRVPSLSERIEDIPGLAHYFLTLFATELKKNIRDFDPDVLELFKKYPWSGNIRELKNVVERAVIFGNDAQPITIAQLPDKIRCSIVGTPFTIYPDKPLTLKQLENDYIQFILAICQGNKSRAAKLLGIDSSTLWRKEEKNNPL
ncbi:MAG: sigma-54-dependent Fis family transcriptional regulator [Planctomycetes bacterium]|nr:sigma-54-dependent Fis family transcriptional regulator [Planctomycetota bacterium]